MKNLNRIHERAEHEIDLIEQDESMTDEEKRLAIKEVYQELRDIERECNCDENW